MSVEASVRRVRVPWRQFQRRHVDPQVVGPHDLAGRRMFDHGLAAGHSVERLVATGADQADRAGIALEVFAADRQQVPDADGVVAIDEPVHARQRAGPAPLPQRVHRRGRPLRLGPEGTEGVLPCGDVRRHVGLRRGERFGVAQPGFGYGVARAVARASDGDCAHREIGSQGVDVGGHDEPLEQHPRDHTKVC